MPPLQSDVTAGEWQRVAVIAHHSPIDRDGDAVAFDLISDMVEVARLQRQVAEGERTGIVDDLAIVAVKSADLQLEGADEVGLCRGIVNRSEILGVDDRQVAGLASGQDLAVILDRDGAGKVSLAEQDRLPLVITHHAIALATEAASADRPIAFPAIILEACDRQRRAPAHQLLDPLAVEHGDEDGDHRHRRQRYPQGTRMAAMPAA